MVDDDPEVLRAVGRDLRRRYGEEYRVVRAGSGPEAVDALGELQRRDEPVALVLADQKMPEVTGVEVLERAAETAPDARRALLTAYADTDAAVRAINQARAHYYLQKPWDPPEENLYPVLDELLDDWRAVWRPGIEGLKLIGHRWSPEAHELKDFLARNQVPYRWLDVTSDPEAKRLLERHELDPDALPVLLFPDDEAPLVQPDPREVAGRVGLDREAEKAFYDLVIVGAGPAGLAAAVYGASEGLRTLLVEQEAPGGQAGTSSKIENYLGFPAGISGGELARRAVTQAKKFEAEILTPRTAVGLEMDGPYRHVTLDDGERLTAYAVLVATGVAYRTLDVPGVDQLTGAGVYYGAAMTEAVACQDEDVYLIGAGNSAGQAALYLAGYARAVHLLVRGDDLGRSMSHYLVEQIENTDAIEVCLNTEVIEARGDERLEELVLATPDGETTVEATALFVLIGAEACTDWLDGVLERCPKGFVLTGADLLDPAARGSARQPKGWPLRRDPYLLEASIPGVFVAGDVRHGSVKRVASGVGEGSVAISFVHQYLETL